MIPKILHLIWVGDQSLRPDNCIDTWREHHPDWDIRVWGNEELQGLDWHNRDHIAAMCGKELNGVADLMRWEILYADGGIVIDADSVCVRPLDDHLLDCEAFACWESEIARPGLIAAGYFGCSAGNTFVKHIIDDIHAEPSVVNDMAWITVGPQRLTDSYRKYGYSQLRIYPSHYFIPRHFTGTTYEGSDPVYAHQFWGSTHSIYNKLHQADVAGGAPAPVAAPAFVPPSALAERHAPYFVQRVPVSSELIGRNRIAAFQEMCAGKRVLHVGCADWPITDINTSLHLQLEPVCAVLDGFDVHQEALDQLAPMTRGRLFSRLEDITESYDLVLVPEVMEHVPNVQLFLQELEAIDAPCYAISVPDAYSCGGGHFEYSENYQNFVEVVHPDHNVWYSPYTLTNTIQKYSSMKVEKMYFFNNISLLALLSKPVAPAMKKAA